VQWDLGVEGLLVLAAMSIGFGLLAALFVPGDVVRRLQALAIDAVACFGVGLFTSEVWFGWATEEDLQPNVDGLSSDEALLAAAVTTLLVVLVLRRLAHHDGRHRAAGAARRH
jgi:hypothetical protein